MLYLIEKGLDKGLSFNIMESVRKGKGLKTEWIEEMKKHEVPDWYIDCCNKIKYMFPKAHAAAYVLSTLRIAYYKIHYPKEYYAVYFSVRKDGIEISSISNLVRDNGKEILSNCKLIHEDGIEYELLDVFLNYPFISLTIIRNLCKSNYDDLVKLDCLIGNDLRINLRICPLSSLTT